MSATSETGPVVCPNCESTHVEKFCAQCGQKRPNHAADYSLWSVLVAAVERVTQYDGRLLRTLRALAIHPGLLTRDHFEGRRSRHLPPFELFVFANVVAWLLVPHLHIYGFGMTAALKLALLKDHWPQAFAWREAISGDTPEVFARRVESASATVNKVTLLFMVPLFASVTKLLLARRPYRGVQCLIFSVHFYCVHMATILVFWGLLFIPAYRYFVARPDVAWGQPWVAIWRSLTFAHFTVAPVLLPYLYKALQRAFLLDRKGAAWRALVLTLVSCSLLRAFFDVGCALMLILV